MHRYYLAALYLVVTTATVHAPPATAQSLRVTDGSPIRLAEATERLASVLSTERVALLDRRDTWTWEGVGFQLQGKSEYTYDDIYRIEQVDYAWTGAAYVPETRYEYAGDDMNNVTATYAWDTETQDYLPVDRTIFDYLYDVFTGAKYVASSVYQVWDGEAYVNSERTTNSFTNNMYYTSSQTDSWDGEAWVPTERETVTEVDGKVHFVMQEFDGSAWVNRDRVIYPYATRAELYEALRDVLAGAGDYDSAIYFIYLLPNADIQTWDGTAWVDFSRQTVYYDFATGRKMHVDFEVQSEGVWFPATRIELAYGESNELAGLAYKINDGAGNFTTFQEESYTWDGEGSLLSIWQSTDYGEGETGIARIDYSWRYTGSSTGHDEVAGGFELSSAYPNPFNPTTRLSYRVAQPGRVSVRVFDSLGREVATLFDGMQPAGSHHVTFDAAGLPSGLYLVRLETGAGQAVRTATLLK